MYCLIIDDNPVARTTLKQLLKQVPDIVLLGECEDATEAFRILQEREVDLLLLDIEMPGMSGLELTSLLQGKPTQVVFISRKEEYAIPAFELQVTDYIVKPVTPVRFLKAIERVKAIRQNSQLRELPECDGDMLFFRDGNMVRRIAFDEILYAEALGDYVKLMTRSSKYYAIHTTLKAVEERLPEDRFLRVHRSFVIAVHKIDVVKNGEIYFGNLVVPLANSYRAALNKKLNIL